jgi:hypothetical protein
VNEEPIEEAEERPTARDLPIWVYARCQTWVRQADAESIQALSQNNPALRKGFRLRGALNAQALDVVRARLASAMRPGMDLLEPELADELTDFSPLAGMLRVVDDDLLLMEWRRWAAALGEEDFLVTCLLSDSPAISDIALEEIRELSEPPSVASPEARASAVDELRLLVLPLMVGLTVVPGSEGSLPAPSGDEPVAADAQEGLRLRVQELEAALQERGDRRKDLRAAQRRSERAEAELAGIRAEAREAREAREKAEKRIVTLEERLAAAAAERDRLEAEGEAAIARAVEERLAEVKHRYLRAALAEEALAASFAADGTALHEQIETLLRRQAEQDRRFGNRESLRAELVVCRAGLDRVRVAAADALQPLAELQDAEVALRTRIEAVERVLGPRAEITVKPVVEALLLRVRAAKTCEGLASLATLIGHLGDEDVLDVADVARLHAAYEQRMAIIYGSRIPGVVTRPALDPAGEAMREAADRGTPLAVFIDGHNVLFQLRALFEADFEEQQPRARAREALVALVQQFAAGRPHLRMHIHFDGPDPRRYRADPNVRVVYSGGKGEGRADRAILDDIEASHRTESAMPRVIVTLDRDLAGKAYRHGALRMDPWAFGEWLKHRTL